MIKENAGLRKSWADGTYTFRLGIGELNAVQANRGAIYKVYSRLLSMETDLEDIRHVIRLSLIGGGQSPDTADRLFTDWVERPGRWNDARDLAQEVMHIALEGVADEELPKPASPEDQIDSPSSDQMGTSPSEKYTPD
jgi:hypothetical protein